MDEELKPYGWLHDGYGNAPLTFVRDPVPASFGLTCSTMAVYTAEQVRELVSPLREALELIAAQGSGIVGSTSRADCMAAIAAAAIRAT